MASVEKCSCYGKKILINIAFVDRTIVEGDQDVSISFRNFNAFVPMSDISGMNHHPSLGVVTHCAIQSRNSARFDDF